MIEPSHRLFSCLISTQRPRIALLVLLVLLPLGPARAQMAIRGKLVYTMEGEPIEDGTVLIRDGKIASIGSSDDVAIPKEYQVLEAAVVTPGLIDAHATVGLTGMLNQNQDQDQLERSAPIQPGLRAVDAYNSRDELIDWVRGFGVTTVHTGHAPGELISGQTMVVKTVSENFESAVLKERRAIATTLSSDARKSGKESPGTRGKMLQMLRSKLIETNEYQKKQEQFARKFDGREVNTSTDDSDSNEPDDSAPPVRDLTLEALSEVLAGETPLLVTANRAQDISNALRLAKEFEFELWLDGAAEAYLLLDEIKSAGVPVMIHPLMARAVGDRENMSFETPAKLAEAGIPFAIQSGFEAYVPKTRVVLFEAAIAAANGLTSEQALASITLDAATILRVDDRVGSLKVGKDGDVALFDGDPFEYTTHCIGTIIDGNIVSRGERE